MKTIYERAKKRYNALMNDAGMEFATIGTDYTEDAESKNQWTIRDMVSEIQYQIDCHYEYGHDYFLTLQGEWGIDSRIRQKKWLYKLIRFVNAFKEEALKEKCFERHCSKYDNHKDL